MALFTVELVIGLNASMMKIKGWCWLQSNIRHLTLMMMLALYYTEIGRRIFKLWLIGRIIDWLC